MTSIRKHRGFMFFLYVLVFLLLLEWLTPIAELTATGYQTVFLVFLGASLFMAFFQVSWWISGGLKAIYILWALLFIFTEHRFFTRDAIAAFEVNIETSFTALFSQNWTGVTDMFRTLLFFVLLWMAVYLLHYWISFRLSIFAFYLFTVIFIAVLDTFSTYSGDAAIIRIMVIGLMLAGLLHLARWLELHHIPLRNSAVIGWLVPLFLMVGTSAAAALLLPKVDPVWPDPVPYLTSHTTSETASSGKPPIGKIGYDQDDSRLGGSFVGDDTVVLRAESGSGQYWKIESKDVYTSHGWELSEVEDEPVFYSDSEPIGALDIEPGASEEQGTAFITMAEERFPFVLYPYGTESFTMEGEADYRYNPADQRIGTYRAGSTFEPYMYEVIYSEPTYSLTALRATSEEGLTDLPRELDRYLQLPETLPERVGDLATAITASDESLYGKARAIEAYFANGEFTYSQTNVPVPAEGQDYVDQFLFETQIGYCDNFSTSMVVMLRSIGIPARWVKGFAEGEEIGAADGKVLYEVTNNNAHSWVEAYLPSVGWIMFEPTIGFAGTANIDFDLELDDSEEDAAPLPEKPDTPAPAENEPEATSANSGLEIGKWAAEFWKEQQTRIIWGVLAVIAVGLILYFLRRKWLPAVLVPYYRLRQGDESFERAYLHLLRQLDLYGIQRKEGETLSAYADYIDKFFGTRDMTVLTDAYEKAVYGGMRHAADWNTLRENWESLINRTSG
ncbi:DUF4129 domain-containing transglutaminase family protein [Planococcus lenghuensis]|uniref:Transglutaminase n=1 Tax=Planococcus lenghuensis TaxID=2213202 RepID=A0A1Q2KW52_9BACL|nr:DUF4129 domain-containing transglutaminase family protein [Planococcus lenghuensis]AQQ52419.1 transglutaminase [Planococcus lenghuensis]